MNITGTDPILNRYRDHAEDLGARFQKMSSEKLYAPVATYLPTRPSTILDVGAGTGRDAAWLAGQGHRVVAVEPVGELSRQAVAPAGTEIEWLDDRLPDLAALRDRTDEFDLVLLSGVWHHVPDVRRPTALACLARLLRPGGHLVVSLRHGPGEDEEMIFASDPDRVVAQGSAAGMSLANRVPAPSVQEGSPTAGVTWTWLVFRRPKGEKS